MSEAAKKDFDALDATGKEVLALLVNTSVPVVILSALKPMTDHSELADNSNVKRIDLARLYPNTE